MKFYVHFYVFCLPRFYVSLLTQTSKNTVELYPEHVTAAAYLVVSMDISWRMLQMTRVRPVSTAPAISGQDLTAFKYFKVTHFTTKSRLISGKLTGNPIE